MRILIFCQYYYPERFLITDIAEKFVKEGNEVTVVTGLPSYNFPGGKVPKEYKDGAHNDEIINGVRIIRCPIRGRGEGKIRRMLNYMDYVAKANKVADSLADEFDIVFSYQLTPVMQVKPAIRYARKNNKKLLCYCLDLAPESGIKLLKRFKLLVKSYKKSAKDIYNACDLIAVTSKSFIEYHNKVNHVPFGKMVYVPQHAPVALLGEDLQKERNDSDKLVLLFAGNIGIGAKLDTVILAAKKLKESNVSGFEIRFVGDGTDKNRLVNMANELDLQDCVKFLDAVPFDHMPQIYREADALLISLRCGQITVPGKLQAYMSTGKPIFGAMDSAGNEMVNESGCGVCVPAERPEELAEVLKDYLEDPDKYRHCGENGRRYFEENFTLEKYSESILRLMRELVGEEDK